MKTIAIIGGGLAGCAAAYILKQSGLTPIIYEAGESLAYGASGNAVGLYNPRISAECTPQAHYYIHAFNHALKVFQSLKDIAFNPCGALHLINNDKKSIRYTKTVKNWGWAENDLRLVNAAQASKIANIELHHDALYIQRSGFVSPRALCDAYTKNVDIRLNTPIHDLSDINADAIIIANAMGALQFKPTQHLPLKPVRGQITHILQTPHSKALKCNLCYGGYISAGHNGTHIVGSSFQPWLNHSDSIAQDDIDNIAKLSIYAPTLAHNVQIKTNRASVRTTAPDHFPIVGALNNTTYVSTAHGSHGILSSLMAAYILRDMIMGQDSILPQQTIEHLRPQRYDSA